MGSKAGRLLIVDDEPMVRAALRRTLRREPWTIVEAADAEEALELLEKQRFDVILADQMLPGASGLELLSHAAERWPDGIRILFTGRADPELENRTLKMRSIYWLLTKPWDDLELKVTLYNALERLSLERENRLLSATIHGQSAALSELQQRLPGVGALQRDEEGGMVISEDAIRAALR